MATIATLIPFVEGRVDEIVESPPIWVTTIEITSALMEAQCDLTLLVGRPDLIVSEPFTILPNQWLQQLPEGMFLATNMQGAASEVWKCTLADMDACQVSDSGWEQDIGDEVSRWFPIGFGLFGVWPNVAQPQTVLLTGIASPVVGLWPYDGSQPVVFHDEQFQALEKYAAHYLEFKVAGQEFEESMADYKSYLADAKRLTQLEDRRDPFVFEGATGAVAVANPNRMR